MGRRVAEKDKTLGKIKKLYLGCLIRERIFLSRRRVRTERGARSHHRLGLCQTVRQAASGKDRSPLRPGWWKTSWPLSFPPRRGNISASAAARNPENSAVAHSTAVHSPVSKMPAV